MKKKVPYLYFCHIYIRTRVSVLCYRGSMCQWWMTEIMWFLSILILTGAPFQKGQEWQSEKFSRGCFRTCFENMKQFNPLDCPWLLRKGCAWRAQEWSGIQTSRTTKLASAGPVCAPSELLEPCRRGLRTASLEVTRISLSFFFSLCAEYFFAHLSYL